MSLTSLEKRVAELEQRVAELEARTADGPDAADVVGRAVDDDTFWALEGLHARAPAPGAVLIVGDVVAPDGRTARWQEGAATDELLDDDWQGVADSLAALGHRARLQLLQHVVRGVDTARELSRIEGMGTTGQVYHHLRQLTAAGWLRNRDGHYGVPAEALVPLLTTVLGGRR